MEKTTGQEIMQRQIVIQETDSFQIVQDPVTKKFTRRAKYVDFASFVPETKEEKIRLFNIMENSDDTVLSMKENFGANVTIRDVVFQSYDKINEDTGELEFGTLTYIFTPEDNVYATSSKSVYFTLDKLFKAFGTPGDKDYEPATVQIVKVESQNGNQVTLKLVQ